MSRWWIVAAALLVDLAVGDPLVPPHPVILMGRYIGWFERRSNRPAVRGNRLRGVLLVITTVGLFAGAAWLALALLGHVSAVLAAALSIWLIATTIAWRGLADAGRTVFRALRDGGLAAGRVAVAHYVGRDTAQLSEAEVVRAAVETLAENVVDAIVAPVLFALVGGAPLALAYRAVNTLDAMVGHKSARYATFGWASARLDDVLNWVPARLTALLMWAALALDGLDARRGWRVMWRDAGRHPSPNSGIPEALMAGALGVRLGGWNWYQGTPEFRAYLGDPGRPLQPSAIPRTIRVVHLVAAALLLLLLAGGAVR